MILRWLRVRLLFAALWVAGSGACFAHEALSGPALLLKSLAVVPSESERELGAIALVLMLAGLTASLGARRVFRGKSRARGDSPRCAHALTAGVLLTLWVWVLPWLSFHETHHALDTHEPACSVVQIVHSQAGGILPALPALIPPLALNTVPAPDPIVLSSRIVPEPAARSPPV